MVAAISFVAEFLRAKASVMGMTRRESVGRQSGSVPAKLSLVVAENLRRLRRKRGLPLDQLAHLSGVSRAMLGQIETGKSAPTINLLARIADALTVSVASLIMNPAATGAVVFPRNHTTVLTSANGRFTRRAIFPVDGPEGIAVFEVTVSARHLERLAPLASGAKKRLFVMSAQIEVGVGEGHPVRLCEGDAVFFNADIEHCIRNPGEIETKAFLVISGLGEDDSYSGAS
jgi:transcriptional regulator with XRE-family HTH domain